MDQKIADDLQGTHALTQSVPPIPATVTPIDTAGVSIGTSRTRLCCSCCRFIYVPVDRAGKIRHQDRRQTQHSGEHRLERPLIGVTSSRLAALSLIDDSGGRVDEDTDTVQKVACTCLPRVVLRVVVKIGTTCQVQTKVVSPFALRDRGTVIVDTGTIVQRVRVVIQDGKAHASHPVPDLLTLIHIRIVRRVTCQTRTDVEHTTVGNRVLVVVTGVPGKDAPSQPTSTVCRVPSLPHRVEDSACQQQPTCLVLWRIREVPLCGSHRHNAPQSLIIVTLGRRAVRRNEIVVGTSAVHQGIVDNSLICGVLTVPPHVQQTSPQFSCLPPIVWLAEHPDSTTVLGTFVVVHHTVCNQPNCTTDRVRVGGVQTQRQHQAAEAGHEKR